MLCLAIGAVVLGVPITVQMPLSGHFSPVRAVVPTGAFIVQPLSSLEVLLLPEKFGIDAKNILPHKIPLAK